MGTGDGSSYLVGYGALGTAIDDVLACHKKLVGARDDLETFLKSLHAEWYGAGKDNWSTQQGDWNNACEEINGMLYQLGQALTVALDNYYHADLSIQRLWGG